MWTAKIGITVGGAVLGSLVYFASDAQSNALMAPATRDAIFVLFVLWVAAIIMLGMIGQNLDAAIHRKDGA